MGSGGCWLWLLGRFPPPCLSTWFWFLYFGLVLKDLNTVLLAVLTVPSLLGSGKVSFQSSNPGADLLGTYM